MAAASVLAAALTWTQGMGLLRGERRMALEGSRAFLWHLLRLPIQYFDRNYVSALGERVPLNARLARFLHRDLAVNALGAVLALCFLLLMARYSLALTAAAAAVLAVDALALGAVARRRRDAGSRLLQEEMRMNGTALLGLRQIETVKAGAGEADLFARWSAYQARVVNARQELTRSTHLLEAVPPFLAAASAALVLGIGGGRVIAGEMTLGMLVAFQVLMASFLAPAGRLVGLGSRLQTAEVDVRRLDDVLEQPPALPADAGEEEPGAPRARLSGRLELRGVDFGFAPLEPPLLRGLDLRLEPGRWVALVGPTGSGKSTVARLAAGLYEPWSGEVLLDGVPRGGLPRSAVAGSLAVVDQEVFLFAGTVRENLALWDDAVPLERIEAAARDACILDEIRARGGWDARVEERGANWSGGERQRLEIARALALDPAVLVLDEATSALDPLTEARIAAHLRRRGCACLLVAHRLSTIRGADEVLVLEAGRVVQRGAPAALDGEHGPFRALLAAE
jgi:ABC-type bacteriocin/lantibiotic exporter with double-glycine peptidase domain